MQRSARDGTVGGSHCTVLFHLCCMSRLRDRSGRDVFLDSLYHAGRERASTTLCSDKPTRKWYVRACGGRDLLQRTLNDGTSPRNDLWSESLKSRLIVHVVDKSFAFQLGTGDSVVLSEMVSNDEVALTRGGTLKISRIMYIICDMIRQCGATAGCMRRLSVA